MSISDATVPSADALVSAKTLCRAAAASPSILHVVTGAPAAGKSTYGRQLAATLRAAFLDIDTASEKLVQAALAAMHVSPNDRDSPFFKTTFRDAIYESVFAIAEENLPHTSVVIAGPFSSEKLNAAWKAELEQRFNTGVVIHYVHCSEVQLKHNMQRRQNPRDAYKLANWEQYAQGCNLQPPLYPHVLVQPTYT